MKYEVLESKLKRILFQPEINLRSNNILSWAVVTDGITELRVSRCVREL